MVELVVAAPVDEVDGAADDGEGRRTTGGRRRVARGDARERRPGGARDREVDVVRRARLDDADVGRAVRHQRGHARHGAGQRLGRPPGAVPGARERGGRVPPEDGDRGAAPAGRPTGAAVGAGLGARLGGGVGPCLGARLGDSPRVAARFGGSVHRRLHVGVLRRPRIRGRIGTRIHGAGHAGVGWPRVERRIRARVGGADHPRIGGGSRVARAGLRGLLGARIGDPRIDGPRIGLLGAGVARFRHPRIDARVIAGRRLRAAIRSRVLGAEDGRILRRVRRRRRRVSRPRGVLRRSRIRAGVRVESGRPAVLPTRAPARRESAGESQGPYAEGVKVRDARAECQGHGLPLAVTQRVGEGPQERDRPACELLHSR